MLAVNRVVMTHLARSKRFVQSIARGKRFVKGKRSPLRGVLQ